MTRGYREDIDWLRAFEIVRDWPRPDFPIRGRDVAALGISAGPEIGRLLKDLENWWIAGDFAADRDHGLAELKRRAEAMRRSVT